MPLSDSYYNQKTFTTEEFQEIAFTIGYADAYNVFIQKPMYFLISIESSMKNLEMYKTFFEAGKSAGKHDLDEGKPFLDN